MNLGMALLALKPRTWLVSVPRRIFPVISPVISLIIPCYDSRLEAMYSDVYDGKDAISPHQRTKIPCIIPCHREFWPETGSQETGSSARIFPLSIYAFAENLVAEFQRIRL